ncbi:MAG: ATP-binding cassette domain-containing protein [Planctomycetota bacterium]|nr:ATP-binding cassette domain-containing protein [Planctomycetota bacterium]MDI6788024.1 ATP-binding cassette domain-containing protein [Planctomycetota bacterium]
MNYLEVANVNYQRDGHTLLDNVSFAVGRGEFWAVAGSDISGKTLLLKTCAGLVNLNRGTVKIKGKEISTFSYDELQQLKMKTGFVFQDAVLLSNLTIRDNITLPLRYHTKLDAVEINKQSDKHLKLLNIFAYANERPAGLPLEVRLLTNLARALIAEPELLLLDQLFDTLSIDNVQKVVGILGEFKSNQGLTCLYTTKLVNLLSSFIEQPLVDNIILMESGRIVEQGRCEVVREKLIKKLL